MENQSENKKGKSKLGGLPDRKSIRLKGYDYSKAGLYFVTLCCQDRKHRFGKIENGEMILNENGKIAYDEWFKLSERFPNMELDEFQIMPNHIHFIAELTVGSTLAVDPIEISSVDSSETRAGASPAPTKNQNNNENSTEIPVGSTLAVDPTEMLSVDPSGILLVDSSEMRAGASPAPTESQNIITNSSEIPVGATLAVDPTEMLSVDPTDILSVDPTEILLFDHTEILSIDPIEISLVDSSEMRAGASPAPTESQNIIANSSPDASTAPTSVGDIIGAYKSLVFNGCLSLYKNRNQQMGKFWQRNYYEHIIRDEQAYYRISNYIKNNPKMWGKDKFYKK